VYLPTLLSPADAEVNERDAILVLLELNTDMVKVNIEQVLTTGECYKEEICVVMGTYSSTNLCGG